MLFLLQNYCIMYTFNNNGASACVLGCLNLLANFSDSGFKAVKHQFPILVDVLGFLLLRAKPLNATCLH